MKNVLDDEEELTLYVNLIENSKQMTKNNG